MCKLTCKFEKHFPNVKSPAMYNRSRNRPPPADPTRSHDTAYRRHQAPQHSRSTTPFLGPNSSYPYPQQNASCPEERSVPTSSRHENVISQAEDSMKSNSPGEQKDVLPLEVPTTADVQSTAKTKGRQKVNIQYISESRARQVSFLKRKNGVLKKAFELSVLSGCEMAVIIFNNDNGKLYEYFSNPAVGTFHSYAEYTGSSERRLIKTMEDKETVFARAHEAPARVERGAATVQQQRSRQTCKGRIVERDVPARVPQSRRPPPYPTHVAAVAGRACSGAPSNRAAVAEPQPPRPAGTASIALATPVVSASARQALALSSLMAPSSTPRDHSTTPSWNMGVAGRGAGTSPLSAARRARWGRATPRVTRTSAARRGGALPTGAEGARARVHGGRMACQPLPPVSELLSGVHNAICPPTTATLTTATAPAIAPVIAPTCSPKISPVTVPAPVPSASVRTRMSDAILSRPGERKDIYEAHPALTPISPPPLPSPENQVVASPRTYPFRSPNVMQSRALADMSESSSDS